jgi:GDPmannose 4,6-dehydratase
VDTLLGDASKARRQLGWEPQIGFEELIREMVVSDLREAEKDAMIRRKGYPIFGHSE